MKWILILFSVLSLTAQVLVDPYSLVVAASAGNNLADDLLAYWKFDETSGNPQDSSGNGRHLTHFGDAETIAGKIVNARFHASSENDDYFSVASDAWNSFGSGNFTIAYWFSPNPAAGVVEDQAHIAKADLGLNLNSWAISIDRGAYAFDNAMTFFRSTDGTVFTESLNVPFDEILSSVWYCCIVRRLGNVFTMFLGREGDGAFIGTASVTESITLFDNSTIPVTVGVYLTSGAPFDNQDAEGSIDELVISSRGWNDCEVYKYFNAGAGRSKDTYDSNPCL